MALKPPSKLVKTVRDLIYWLYAELIARAAGFKDNYGFVISRYKKLKSGEMTWSSSIRDHLKEWEKGKVCVYCGAEKNLTLDHIVPSSRAGVDPRIKEMLESTDNTVCVFPMRIAAATLANHFYLLLLQRAELNLLVK